MSLPPPGGGGGWEISPSKGEGAAASPCPGLTSRRTARELSGMGVGAFPASEPLSS